MKVDVLKMVKVKDQGEKMAAEWQRFRTVESCCLAEALLRFIEVEKIRDPVILSWYPHEIEVSSRMLVTKFKVVAA